MAARPDPVPALKAQLGAELARAVTGWNAHEIALLIGTEAARISDLRRGRLRRFSLETLIRYADRVRLDVSIIVTRRKVGKEVRSGGKAESV